MTIAINRIHHTTYNVKRIRRLMRALHLQSVCRNKKYKLIPGSTVAVMLDRKIASNCPAITPSAVMHDNKAAYVYVLDKNNVVSRRDVVLGSERGNFVIVEKGLKPGETIIVDGTHKARPGTEVEIAK